MKIARRHQQPRRDDDDGRQRPKGENQAQRQVDQGAPFPAHFARQRIAFQHQVGRRHPGAQEIHPAREEQQRQEDKVAAAGKRKNVPGHFLP